MNVWNDKTIQRVERYVERHFAHLEDILSALKDNKTDEHYLRRNVSVQLDAAGNGTLTLQVPQGYDYILQRVTLTTGGGGTVVFYIDIPQNTNVVEVVGVGASGLYSDSFANNIFVPGGSSLITSFLGAGANAQATANLQIKQIRQELQHVRKLGTWGSGER